MFDVQREELNWCGRKLTLETFAARTGFSRTHLNDIERGKRTEIERAIRAFKGKNVGSLRATYHKVAKELEQWKRQYDEHLSGHRVQTDIH
jgi:transcriptional regulator with XRE-family HTH domain